MSDFFMRQRPYHHVLNSSTDTRVTVTRILHLRGDQLLAVLRLVRERGNEAFAAPKLNVMTIH